MAKKSGNQRVGAIRCAVYTRKSTEEGLDQEFNSLDAQREASEAYITSQRHEGWVLVKEAYDDGGFSGGNMERPGLKRLLADVEAGRVDVIVVYKVDRLTRSLADFAKIVEVLDAKGASFVSVTQAFNTTTSMGRLTLNVLLSFAQFEREVTGERIRDKVAASKAKGMWMGGTVPLGYDVVDKKLVVNEPEAQQVRHIMERYVATGGGRALLAELEATGYRTKRYASRGGNVFGRGPLYHLLNNRMYLGEIRHRDSYYPGEQEPIVSQELWDEVQRVMSGNRIERSRGSDFSQPSLLAGRIFDGEGRRMTPNHAVKKGRRYRYYITAPDQLDAGSSAWRVPAHDVEVATIQLIQSMLAGRRQVVSLIGSSKADVLRDALHHAHRQSQRLEDTCERRALLHELELTVHLSDEHVEVRLAPNRIAALLGGGVDVTDGEPIYLRAPAVKARRGQETKLIILDDRGRADKCRDKGLIALLVEARDAYKLVLDHPDQSIRRLIRQVAKCRHRFYRLLRIAMLAPDIVIACTEGTQPIHLTPAVLLETDLPISWQEQRERLGFA
ncbi:MAG: recombinase family protein [Rhizorhabdus sp.]|uniref:recombinase family protein n=1 Tax=Rhizorhabdus sp. TaxID=1968843 RepID=UPI001B4F4D98|nr:recombinase family protein [Rhizorhabdus sp.]MBP8231596.1 recombinase family protein [Rhizorhabdus sp.]